ncbi:MAG TPA: hypothetical protein VFO29_03715 [Candidatus Rubrimentiphilum sp.]|nr:hypothetical protein [Candidatus Rubrimentiphilum sp.]
MKYAALGLALALLPITASAKQTLGVLHHGSDVIEFVLNGSNVTIEQAEAGGTRNDISVRIRDMGCTSVGANHTMTMKARGLKMRPDETSKNNFFIYNFQKGGSRSWVYNRNEDLDALALAEKLNRLAHCK